MSQLVPTLVLYTDASKHEELCGACVSSSLPSGAIAWLLQVLGARSRGRAPCMMWITSTTRDPVVNKNCPHLESLHPTLSCSRQRFLHFQGRFRRRPWLVPHRLRRHWVRLLYHRSQRPSSSTFYWKKHSLRKLGSVSLRRYHYK